MFTSASRDNIVVVTDLTVDYKIDEIYEDQAQPPFYWYVVTRQAKKSYKYIDMTEKAAIAAENDKVRQYTRTTRKCITFNKVLTFPNLTSNIQIRPTDCGSFDLEIEVIEEDSTFKLNTPPADPASLFTEENARDYDEGDGGIELVSSSYGMHIGPTEWALYVNLTATVIGAASAQDIEFQIQNPYTGNWTDLGSSGATISVSGNTATCTWDNGPYDMNYGTTILQKAVIGSVESNTVAINWQ